MLVQETCKCGATFHYSGGSNNDMSAAASRFHIQHSVCFQVEATPDPSTTDFEHWVERVKTDIHVLHVWGCEVTTDNKDAKCSLMDFLKDATVDSLRELMPKSGDYVCTQENDQYRFRPWGKDEKKVVQSDHEPT